MTTVGIISISLGMRRVASSTRAGTGKRPRMGPSTKPRKRSSVVQIPPDTTWKKSRDQRALVAMAATKPASTAATAYRPRSGTIRKSLLTGWARPAPTATAGEPDGSGARACWAISVMSHCLCQELASRQAYCLSGTGPGGPMVTATPAAAMGPRCAGLGARPCGRPGLVGWSGLVGGCLYPQERVGGDAGDVDGRRVPDPVGVPRDGVAPDRDGQGPDSAHQHAGGGVVRRGEVDVPGDVVDTDGVALDDVAVQVLARCVHVDGHPRLAVALDEVVSNGVVVVGSPRQRHRQQDPGTLALGAVADDRVVLDQVVVHAPSRWHQLALHEGGGRVARHGDAAVQDVAPHNVVLDHVVVRRPARVSDQGAARVVLHQVAGDHRVGSDHEVDALAAVAGDLARGVALAVVRGADGGAGRVAQVVAPHDVAADGHVGNGVAGLAYDQDALPGRPSTVRPSTVVPGTGTVTPTSEPEASMVASTPTKVRGLVTTTPPW